MSDNNLNDSRGSRQSQDEWETISIAVSPELKEQFNAAAEQLKLKPSQFGRMLIADALNRAKAA